MKKIIIAVVIFAFSTSFSLAATYNKNSANKKDVKIEKSAIKQTKNVNQNVSLLTLKNGAQFKIVETPFSCAAIIVYLVDGIEVSRKVVGVYATCAEAAAAIGADPKTAQPVK